MHKVESQYMFLRFEQKCYATQGLHHLILVYYVSQTLFKSKSSRNCDFNEISFIKATCCVTKQTLESYAESHNSRTVVIFQSFIFEIWLFSTAHDTSIKHKPYKRRYCSRLHFYNLSYQHSHKTLAADDRSHFWSGPCYLTCPDSLRYLWSLNSILVNELWIWTIININIWQTFTIMILMESASYKRITLAKAAMSFALTISNIKQMWYFCKLCAFGEVLRLWRWTCTTKFKYRNPSLLDCLQLCLILLTIFVNHLRTHTPTES